MKYENILWGSVAWTTFTVLLPLPDWLTAVLVIIGAAVVGMVAYGIGRDRRMFTKGSHSMDASVDTLAHELADTLANRPEMLQDVPREEKLEETMRRALGDMSTVNSFAPTYDEPVVSEIEMEEIVTIEPAEIPTPKPARKRSVRHLTPESEPAERVVNGDEA